MKMKTKIWILILLIVAIFTAALYIHEYQKERQGRIDEQQVTDSDCCAPDSYYDSITPKTDSITQK